MSINKFFQIIVKKIWVLLLAVFIFSATGFVVSKFIMKPQYASNGLVYISAKNTQITSNNDMILSKALVDSYMIIIDSDSFIDIVKDDIAKLDVKYTTGQLKAMTKTKKDETALTITIKNGDAEHANIICESYLKNIVTEIPKLVPTLQPYVCVLTPSKLATSPASPNVLLYTIISFAIGFIIGILVILIWDKFDDRIKSEEDLSENFNIPLLGVIYDNLGNDMREVNNETK